MCQPVSGVRQYAKEEKSVWEDVWHGFIMGSRSLTEEIRKRFLAAREGHT